MSNDSIMGRKFNKVQSTKDRIAGHKEAIQVAVYMLRCINKTSLSVLTSSLHRRLEMTFSIFSGCCQDVKLKILTSNPPDE